MYFWRVFQFFFTWNLLFIHSLQNIPTRKHSHSHKPLFLFKKIYEPKVAPTPTPTLLDIGNALSSEKLIELATEKHIVPTFLLQFYQKIPLSIKSILHSLYPFDLFVFFSFQLTYKRVLRILHFGQSFVWRMFALGTPLPFEQSILGFFEERNGVLAKLMMFNYITELACELLCKIGFRTRHDFANLISRVSYALFAGEVIILAMFTL